MSIPPPLQEARIALLIDADNAPAAKIDVILAELAKIGVANIRRAYGNWKKSELRGWEEVLHDYAIRPIQQFDYSRGKNATDMGMVIDAMDLLYTDRPEAFGIVSSDSDFTPLVLHLKAKGAKVYGFGAKKTPTPFVNACSRFLYLENLGQPDALLDTAEPMSSASGSSRSGRRGRGGRSGAGATQGNTAPQAAMAAGQGGGGSGGAYGGQAGNAGEARGEGAPLRMDRSALKQDARLVTLLRNAVESAAGEDGWSPLGAVGQQIGNQASFDPRNYGYRKLIDLIDATQLFDLDRRGTQFVLRDKRQGGSPQPFVRGDAQRDGSRDTGRDASRDTPRDAPREHAPREDAPRDTPRDTPRDVSRDLQRGARDAARDVFLDLQRESDEEDQEGQPAQVERPEQGRSPARDPQGGQGNPPRQGGDARAGSREARREPRGGRGDRKGRPERSQPAVEAARPPTRHHFELPADSPARQFADAFREEPYEAWEPEFDEPAPVAPAASKDADFEAPASVAPAPAVPEAEATAKPAASAEPITSTVTSQDEPALTNDEDATAPEASRAPRKTRKPARKAAKSRASIEPGDAPKADMGEALPADAVEASDTAAPPSDNAPEPIANPAAPAKKAARKSSRPAAKKSAPRKP